MLSRGWCKVSLEQLVDEPCIPIDRSCQAGGKDTKWSLIDKDVSSQKREVFVPLANLSLDCKRLGGCVYIAWLTGWRAQVWSDERPPLIPKGKELEARLRAGTIGFRKAGF